MAKIALFTDVYPSKAAVSSGIFVQDQAWALAKVHEVDVFHLQSIRKWPVPRLAYLRPSEGAIAKAVSVQSVPYFSLPRHYAHQGVLYALGKKVQQLISAKDYDLAIFHNILPAGGLIPHVKRVFPALKCVLMVHGSDWYTKWSRPRLRNVMRTAMDVADHLWLSGPALERDIFAELPSLNTSHEVVFNLMPFTEAASEDSASTRQQFGWLKDERVLMTVANAAPVKGLDIMIDALARLEGSLWDRWVVFGQSPDPAYTLMLKKRASDLGMAKKIDFAGVLTRGELQKAYLAADVYVLPSRNEGFNVSLLEAIHSDLPIIATDCGGASLLFEERSLLAKAGDLDSLHERLKLLLASESEWGRFKGRQDFLEQHCTQHALLQRVARLLSSEF